MLPRYLEKIAERLEWFGFEVSKGTGAIPSTLPGRLVPLAKLLHWYGFQVTEA
jgi:hypothetical protein